MTGVLRLQQTEPETLGSRKHKSSTNYMQTIVGFSGGNDSTAMVLRMAELGEDFSCLFTPVRNEPPELFEHVRLVAEMIQRHIVEPPNVSLMGLIIQNRSLPNFRARWCTRQGKIEPTIAYLMGLPEKPVYCVGFRADEETREGLYGEYATYRYPLQEWGWNLHHVLDYLDQRGVHPPTRTNCMLCYDQRLSEWWELWRDKPDEYDKGVVLEAMHAPHTFRSPSRDTQPAGLKALREKFETGFIPRGSDYQPSLLDEEKYGRCRICRL